LHDEYTTLDNSLRLKIEVAELIIRYELEEFEVLDPRIGQVQKDFKNLLMSKDYNREKMLIKILKAMSTSVGVKYDKKLKEKIDAFLNAPISAEQEETEIIKYNN